MLCSERRDSETFAPALLEPTRSIGCYRLAFGRTGVVTRAWPAYTRYCNGHGGEDQ
jgi:hypothetical protein